MKKLAKISTYLLIITLLISVMPTDAEANIYEDTIRLHILANSDSPEDQELKIRVRDGLLLKYGERLRLAGSFEGAESLVRELIPEIEKYAESLVGELGEGYPVKAVISKEWYETRDYDGFSLPCGYYTSLRILIGEGRGQNWWCVVFPTLCVPATSEWMDTAASGGMTGEEVALMEGQETEYIVKFKCLEWLDWLKERLR